MEYQLTTRGLAAELGVSPDTIQRWRQKDMRFQEAYDRGVEKGRNIIRMKQMEKARMGDREMLKWLGQQYCEQASTSRQKIGGDDASGPIKFHTLADLAGTITQDEISSAMDEGRPRDVEDEEV